MYPSLHMDNAKSSPTELEQIDREITILDDRRTRLINKMRPPRGVVITTSVLNIPTPSRPRINHH
jgi:hypothetical protein